ncbi:MaoC/PaaZ C-terminal domain-containing protein [Rhizorhabdus sp.]|uniref:MaoC/PaaZ C-terminal domain-containing protein n=1 Tax=Rhizorhabdus sp. TaxID=1968843 RepID=UPI0035B1C429
MDIDRIRGWGAEPTTDAYDAQRTILYALGIGLTPDGPDLDFVYEARLRAFPTMAVTLGAENFLRGERHGELDWSQVLHAAQSVEWHRPLPPTGRVVARSEVEAVVDRGAGRGALIQLARHLSAAEDGERLATLRFTLFARGDGGGGVSFGSLDLPTELPPTPPDDSLALPTRPDLAAIYRLSGDFNPLHIDPDAARHAGFDRPILHGLCSYGIAARALSTMLLDGACERLARLDVRFSAPVVPGDTLVTELWRTGARAARFRVRARDVTVLDKGLVRWR